MNGRLDGLVSDIMRNMHKSLFALLRVVFFGMAAIGFFVTLLLIKALLMGAVLEHTPYSIFVNCILIIATCGYLFLALQIENLLPAWRVQIIGFIFVLWAVDISGQFFDYFFPGPAMRIMAILLPPTTEELLTGLIASALFPLFMIWAVNRLAKEARPPSART